jgi:hypothetical protein
MMWFSPLIILAAACRVDPPVGKGDTAETSSCKEIVPPADYPTYTYTQSEVHQYSYSYQANPVEEPINMDTHSFVSLGGELTAAGVISAFRDAIAYWVDSSSSAVLNPGDTGLLCCTSTLSSGCAACQGDDSMIDVVMYDTGDAELDAAAITSTQGYAVDVGAPGGCIRHQTITFFTISPGNGRFNWVDDPGQVDTTQDDWSDGKGVVDKPVDNTMIHEFGHILSLSTQMDTAVACSVEAYEAGACTLADGSAGAATQDWNSIADVDEQALLAVYP